MYYVTKSLRRQPLISASVLNQANGRIKKQLSKKRDWIELHILLICNILANYKEMCATKTDYSRVFIYAHNCTLCETRQFNKSGRICWFLKMMSSLVYDLGPKFRAFLQCLCQAITFLLPILNLSISRNFRTV